MKVAIVGAGVTGVAAAHRLSCDGHAVTVFDRAGRAAEGASFAPGGLIGPGWHLPWSGPDGRRAAGPGATPTWRRMPRPAEWSWWWRWRRSAGSADREDGLAALHALSVRSQGAMADLQDRLQLDHDRSEGLLVLLRSGREQAWAAPVLTRLRGWGLSCRELDPAAARRVEPALRADTPLAGAIELPSTGAANCREWTLLVRQAAIERGCRFEMGSAVTALAPRGQGGIDLHRAGQPPQPFDVAVLCNGVSAGPLLRPMGLSLPVLGLQSCSISAPIREPLDAPVSAVLDAATGLAITRLGQRVRVSGGRLLSHPDTTPDPATLRRLYDALLDWFPGAARLTGPKSGLQEWQGTCAVLPDGLPLIGPTRVPGVWLNVGHGEAGWSLACGAAGVLADEMAGQASPGEAGPFRPTARGL